MKIDSLWGLKSLGTSLFITNIFQATKMKKSFGITLLVIMALLDFKTKY